MLFVRDGNTWSHQAYLKAPNREGGDYFGHSSAIAGDTIVVGGYREGSGTTTIIHGSDLSSTDETALVSGAAYVFQ